MGVQDMRIPTKEEIVGFYGQAIERVLSGFSRLEDKEWRKKASKSDSHEWTAKDHLAHLTITYELETVPLTKQALAGEPANIPGFASRSDAKSFRNSTLEQVRDVPVPDLLSRLEASLREEQSLLSGLTEADLDRPANSPSWDVPGTVRDLFFAAYLFLPGQYQEIRTVSKKKLPHWIESSNTDQVHYHLDRVFNYMPLILNREAAADMEVTFLFTMEGDGGGQWSVKIDRGKAVALAGATDDPDSEIKTKPQLWMDLSNGQLNVPMAIATRKVKLGGSSPTLAMKLGGLFSAEG